MMARELGFYKQCSPERCKHLEDWIKRHCYKPRTSRGERKRCKYQVRRKEGMDVEILHAFAPNAGIPMRFWRCFEYDWVQSNGEKRTDTCTTTAEYRVPQGTVDCFKNVAQILQTLRPIKRGRPAALERAKVSSEVLALAGCSAQIERANAVRRIYVPAQITPTIAAKVTGHDLRVTRQAVNNLVYQGKLIGAKKPRGEKQKELLHVLQEKAYQMPKDYAVTFQDFLEGELARRERASRKLFGKALSPVDMPSARKREFRGGAEIIKKGEPMPEGFMMGTTARMRAAEAEEAWRRRTGLARPRYVAIGKVL